jgi:DNA primase
VLYGLGAEPARRALGGGARPVLVEGPLDAIAVTCAGTGRYAGALRRTTATSSWAMVFSTLSPSSSTAESF